jgi:hypothetical protein
MRVKRRYDVQNDGLGTLELPDHSPCNSYVNSLHEVFDHVPLACACKITVLTPYLPKQADYAFFTISVLS